MSDNNNGRKSVSAICPNCEKEIAVNPTEEVVFCNFCNKPLNVKDAIYLHIEHTERSKAAKKPSDEAIAKFNAILEQDYKLAKTYLDDIIKKDYPRECEKHLAFGFGGKESHWNVPAFLSQYLYEYERTIDRIQQYLQYIYSVNPYIGKMYYAIFCRHINNLYKQEKGCVFNGELAFLKLRLINFTRYLNYFVDRITLYPKSYWETIEKNIAEHNRLFELEYDDEYIDSLIKSINDLRYKSILECMRSYGVNVNNVFLSLENYYSPAKKEKIKKAREEEKRLKEKAEKEKAEAEKKRKYKEAFDEEVFFWQRYIDLLKSGKTKRALALLETKPTSKGVYLSEFAKYKRTLFGYKYTDDVSSLQAKTLAELSMENYKEV